MQDTKHQVGTIREHVVQKDQSGSTNIVSIANASDQVGTRSMFASSFEI